MEGRVTSTVGDSALIDITRVPLAELAHLTSPGLSRLLDELEARAGRPDDPFDFSSAI